MFVNKLHVGGKNYHCQVLFISWAVELKRARSEFVGNPHYIRENNSPPGHEKLAQIKFKYMSREIAN